MTRRRDDGTALADYADAAYNPRAMGEAAAAGLRESLRVFGDLSGLVVNDTTGRIVCGHQRRAQLGALELSEVHWGRAYTVTLGYAGRRFRSRERDGWARLAGGARVHCRRVAWPEGFEKAANLEANNPAIQGEWTPELAELLAEVRADAGEAATDLLLAELDGGSEWIDPDQLAPMPDAASETQADLAVSAEFKKKANARKSERDDTERYLVVVFGSRSQKAALLEAIGLPGDERYVPASGIQIRATRRLEPVEGCQAAPVFAAGATGGRP